MSLWSIFQGWFYVFNFIDWRNFFFSTSLKGIIRKNANHLQTTDTLKRHRRYSIHYHCGWPSLGIWGSATHNGLPASLPEPFLRACGLHRVCTRLKKTKQQSRSMMFRVILCMNPLEKVPFATFYPRWKYLCGSYFFKKRLFQVDSCFMPYVLCFMTISDALTFASMFVTY